VDPSTSVYRKVTVPVGRVPAAVSVSVRKVPAGGVPEGKLGKLGMLDLVVKKAHEQKIADRYYSTTTPHFAALYERFRGLLEVLLLQSSRSDGVSSDITHNHLQQQSIRH
jgi:hypothetical protein